MRRNDVIFEKEERLKVKGERRFYVLGITVQNALLHSKDSKSIMLMPACAVMRYSKCVYISHGNIICVGANIFLRTPSCIGDFDA